MKFLLVVICLMSVSCAHRGLQLEDQSLVWNDIEELKKDNIESIYDTNTNVVLWSQNKSSIGQEYTESKPQREVASVFKTKSSTYYLNFRTAEKTRIINGEGLVPAFVIYAEHEGSLKDLKKDPYILNN